MAQAAARASIGLMAKPFVPKAPLWMLLVATQVPDLLSFGFLAGGIIVYLTTRKRMAAAARGG
jgi:hypothetical protein